MQPSPKVACVLVTTAKGMRYLPGLLDSIASQTFMEHETTVVINGTDSAVLEYLSANWPGVRVIPIHQPVGYAEAIDRGFRESSGEYIANLDDDLELEPDWLELLVAELEADERVGFVTGKTLLYDQRDVINETSQDLYTCGRFLPRGSEQSDLGQYDEPGPTTIASGSASVYRRPAVDRAGWFDVDFDIYCDESDLCLRMILCGYRGRYVPSARA